MGCSSTSPVHQNPKRERDFFAESPALHTVLQYTDRWGGPCQGPGRALQRSKPSENRRASNWTEAGNGSVYPLHIRCEASGFALLLKWTEVMAVVPVLVCLCLWGLKTCDSNFSKFRPPIVFIFCILYIGGNGVTCSSSV